MKSAEERFWSKVNKAGEDDCWEWNGSCNNNGYGRFYLNNKMQRAHRVSWELTNGPIPAGMHVLHTCDNPKCVNPAHCFLGTPQDNMDDKVRKKRQAKGVLHGRAKLTENEVKLIRELYQPYGQYNTYTLAKLFGVGQRTISDIINNKTWARV